MRRAAFVCVAVVAFLAVSLVVAPEGARIEATTAAASPEETTTTGPPVAAPLPVEQASFCHRTASVVNPYVLLTTAVDAIVSRGHGSHTGPVFPEAGPGQNGKWGDIIPPFDYDNGQEHFPGLNWPAGADVLAAGCAVHETIEPPDGTTTTTAETTTTVAITTTTTAAATTTTGPASSSTSSPSVATTTTTPAAAVTTTSAPSTSSTTTTPGQTTTTGVAAGSGSTTTVAGGTTTTTVVGQYDHDISSTAHRNTAADGGTHTAGSAARLRIGARRVTARSAPSGPGVRHRPGQQPGSPRPAQPGPSASTFPRTRASGAWPTAATTPGRSYLSLCSASSSAVRCSACRPGLGARQRDRAQRLGFTRPSICRSGVPEKSVAGSCRTDVAPLR